MAGKPNKPVAGIALMDGRLDMAVYDPKVGMVVDGSSIAIQPGTLKAPDALKHALAQLMAGCRVKWKQLYVSSPTDLLRQIEMPKMSDKDLFTALSSEAERYQAFQGTEAVADFCRQPPNPDSAPGTDRLVFGAVRQDDLTILLQAFSELKQKPTGLDIHISQALRALAGSGVLDAVVQQAGPDALWGTLFHGRSHVWFVLWRGNALVELREVNMDLGAMATEDELTRIILENDIEDELRRTAQGHGQVTVWLAEGLAPDLMQALSVKLEVPIQPLMLGPVVADSVNVPLHPAAIGASMMPLIDFPFGMNFMLGEQGALLRKSSQAAGNTKQGKAPAQASAWVAQLGPMLMGFGVFSMVLMGLLSAGLWGYHQFVVTPELNRVQQQLAQEQAAEQRLTRERDTLKRQYDERAALADVIHRVIQKNRLFPALLEDLHTLTPTSVWVYQLDVDSKVTIKGKGLSETAVVKFAKQFDPLAYLSQVTVDGIAQEMVGTSPVYDFTLSGNTNPSALEPPPPPPEEVNLTEGSPTSPSAAVGTSSASSAPMTTSTASTGAKRSSIVGGSR